MPIGLGNMTDMATMPEAIDVSSGHWFGIALTLLIFFVPLIVLSAGNKREDALNMSLFIAFIGSGILASLNAVNNAAPLVCLALLGGSFLYGFLRG